MKPSNTKGLSILYFSLYKEWHTKSQNGWTKDASVRKTTKVILILIAVHFLTHYQICDLETFLNMHRLSSCNIRMFSLYNDVFCFDWS